MTPFGEKLRTLRAKKGVSQAQMAADLDVSPAYLSALEHGKRGSPSWPLLQKIIQYFGLVWDDAEELKEVAEFSKPKVTIDTSGLNPKATHAANLLAARVGRLDDRALDQLLALLGNRPSRGQ
ncbi:helix-turn-helix domain-containing protein [Kordiimonas sp. SCSIO 12610]|uniref:helix-turn-helix domain-containing protein n=1 Tax=Kordiimonas sp. SCSIO 12610 TaxID=2829597 RepID=UPI00210E0E90|nr:helix-turn-helix domain-containing protein [Kordiimonas sp. SCSIO 12610]UTW55439.1 helix-turn-helix domain-containing protein [Kordiimonas sp. SCSIO 12610]